MFYFQAFVICSWFLAVDMTKSALDPMVLLFEIGLLISRVIELRHKKEEGEEAA